jgi:hypothetical protein
MPIKNRLNFCNEITDFENPTYLKIFSTTKYSENDMANILILQICVVRLTKNKKTSSLS